MARWTSSDIGKMPGVGPITASALNATIGNANNFENGRQRAAWDKQRGDTGVVAQIGAA